MKMGDFEGQTVIITGGASGIGQATALLFADHGANVVIVDRDALQGQQTARKIIHNGGKALYIAADVSSLSECDKAVREARRTFGSIDVLVNNAGIISRTNALTLKEEDWDRVMDVNAKSVYLMAKYVLPHMILAGGGVIVNVASGWGLTGGRDALSYCASKGAVVNMTRAMALDHGHQNIRVNCVCPGDTDTSMLRREAEEMGTDEASFLTEAANRPLQRIGSPKEIAQSILFLAGESASYITGSILVVDGGGLAG